MVKRDKRIERWRQNQNNVRFTEVDAVLLNFGFRKRQRGSHAVYTYENHELTVPVRLPFILPVYVRRLLAVLDAIQADMGEE
jgi:predicted RNA binding protein YcfA (HicA-like mRNA interferase family)